MSSLTNANSLVAWALLNPQKYAGAVRELLNGAGLAVASMTQSKDTEEIRILTGLSEAIGNASVIAGRYRVPAASRAKPPRIWGDESFSIVLGKARLSLQELRTRMLGKTPMSAKIQDEIASVGRTLDAIVHSLPVAGVAAEHPVNTFNKGEFCPDLPINEVTA